MKTLHRYLLGQVIASLVLTVAVFTGVLLLGSVLRELLPLLISQKVTLGLVSQAVGLLIPFMISFALPIGMLTSTLLVFGRFSADQELTAARASGISLLSLIAPVVLLSLLLSGLSLYVNLEVAPRSRVAFNLIRNRAQAALLNIQLPEGRVINDFPGYVLYVKRNRNQELEDVWVYVLGNETNIQRTIHAPRGLIENDPTNRILRLYLYDPQMVEYFSTNTAFAPSIKKATIDFKWGEQKSRAGKPKITDMTYGQLREELRQLELLVQPPLPLDPKAGVTGKTRAKTRAAPQDIASLIRVQIHRRWAFSFACFGFTLVGIPLGIRVHRRETNIGIAIALGLLLVYYALIIFAESLAGRPELAPHLLMWLPNFLFQTVGAVLLWRANRGV